MKISPFLRSARAPLIKSILPSSFLSTYSALRRVNVNQANDQVQQVIKPVIITSLPIARSISKTDSPHQAMLQQIIKEQGKLNELLTSIKLLQVGENEKAKTIVLPDVEGGFQCLNRSARHPRRANRGKRPVSRQARRAKKRRWGNHKR